MFDVFDDVYYDILNDMPNDIWWYLKMDDIFDDVFDLFHEFNDALMVNIFWKL